VESHLDVAKSFLTKNKQTYKLFEEDIVELNKNMINRIKAAIRILTGADTIPKLDIEETIKREEEERKQRAIESMRVYPRYKEPAMVHRLKHVITPFNTKIYCNDIELEKCEEIYMDTSLNECNMKLCEAPLSEEAKMLIGKQDIRIIGMSRHEDVEQEDKIIDIIANFKEEYIFHVSNGKKQPTTTLFFTLKD
jgi:hypothetical protein